MAASPAELLGVQETICKRLALGESLRQICRDEDFPHISSVQRWLGQDENFREQYARAREEQAEYLAEECLEIADSADPETANAARLQVDTRKWFIGKTCKGKWGDRPAETHVTSVTNNNLILLDESRLIELQQRTQKQLAELTGQ